jgi:hypothetical protein
MTGQNESATVIRSQKIQSPMMPKRSQLATNFSQEKNGHQSQRRPRLLEDCKASFPLTAQEVAFGILVIALCPSGKEEMAGHIQRS